MSIAFPIPVTCEHCGNVFASPFAVSGEGDVSFKGVSVGPCPNCGKSSMIPEGVYKASAKLGAIFFAEQLPRHAAGDLIAFLKANFKNYQVQGGNWSAAGATASWTVVDPKAPKADAVAKPEDRAVADKADAVPKLGDLEVAEKIAAKIESEIPAIKKDNILKVLAAHGMGIVQVTALVLFLLKWYMDTHPPAVTSASVVGTRRVPAIVQAKEHAKPKTYRRKAPKLGRNDPCSCRSGVKAKKCHPELCK